MTVAVVGSIGTLLLVLAVFLGVKHFNKKTDPMTVNKGKRNTALNFHLFFFHSVYKKRKKSVYLIIIKILLQIINMCGGNIYLISPSFFRFLNFSDHSEDNIIYSDVRVKQHARKTASD